MIRWKGGGFLIAMSTTVVLVLVIYTATSPETASFADSAPDVMSMG